MWRVGRKRKETCGGWNLRGKKLAYNTISSLAFEAASIICGFILPRAILTAYGSEVNGLVNSITQFLSLISFMELGVGAVVQAALYSPLASGDNARISRIMASAQKFFRQLAVILLVYAALLIIFYPGAVSHSFSRSYTVLLIASVSVSSFAQYYFGVGERLLLTADQRGCIQYTAQTLTLIMNTAASVLLIRLGAGIQIVKLAASLIYLIRPLFLRWYVDTHYSIDRKVRYTAEPIAQKWNGMAQHIASVVLDGTDTVVLTIFSDLSAVSVYSVYYLAVHGVRRLFVSAANGVQSLLGELWAEDESETLRRTFLEFEWITHTAVTCVFGCTAVLIVPFVEVYTAGVNDAEYIQPLFAVLLTLSYALHCLRLPYNVMILAAGHFRQTQSNYIIASVMNIVISVLAVTRYGLPGVALGTMAAMIYQTVWMARYNSANLVRGTFRGFVKHVIVDTVTFAAGMLASSCLAVGPDRIMNWFAASFAEAFAWLPAGSSEISAWLSRDFIGDPAYLPSGFAESLSWLSAGQPGILPWLALALKTVLVWLGCSAAVNMIFYRDMVKELKG